MTADEEANVEGGVCQLALRYHPDKVLPSEQGVGAVGLFEHGGLLLKHRTRIRLVNIVQISSISITVFAAHRAWAAARARTVEGIY